MLSVILSLACAFMVLKVILMLVSCFKTDFKSCMILLHFELILACWVKKNCIINELWKNLFELLDCSCSIDYVGWTTFEDECSQGGDIVIPRTLKCVPKLKFDISGKLLLSVKSAKRIPKRAVLIATAHEGHRPGDFFQSPGEVTKTASITRRGHQNGPWCRPS